MAHLTFLEQFEADDVAVSFGPPAQDLPGYDAGYEAGLADAAKEKEQLSTALVDRLTEMRFGYAEAQQEMMSALVPFVSALSDQILPALTDDLTRAHVVEALTTAAEADIRRPISLTFHPATAALVRDALQKVASIDVQLSEDATLSPQDVHIGREGAESQFNVGELIAGIQAALSNISAVAHGAIKNG